MASSHPPPPASHRRKSFAAASTASQSTWGSNTVGAPLLGRSSSSNSSSSNFQSSPFILSSSVGSGPGGGGILRHEYSSSYAATSIGSSGGSGSGSGLISASDSFPYNVYAFQNFGGGGGAAIPDNVTGSFGTVTRPSFSGIRKNATLLSPAPSSFQLPGQPVAFNSPANSKLRAEPSSPTFAHPQNIPTAARDTAGSHGSGSRSFRAWLNGKVPFAAIITFEIFLCSVLVAATLMTISLITYNKSTTDCVDRSKDSQRLLTLNIQSQALHLVSAKTESIVSQTITVVQESLRLWSAALIAQSQTAVIDVYYGDQSFGDFIGVEVENYQALEDRRYIFRVLDAPKTRIANRINPKRCPESCTQHGVNTLGLYDFWVNQTGSAVNVTAPVVVRQGYVTRERPWYTSAAAVSNGTMIWTPPYLFGNNVDLGVTVALPLYGASGLTGVLAADLTIKDITRQLADIKSGLTENAFIFIFSTDGVLLGTSVSGEEPVAVVDGIPRVKYTSEISDPTTRLIAKLVNDTATVPGDLRTIPQSGSDDTADFLYSYSTATFGSVPAASLSYVLVVGVPKTDYTRDIDATSDRIRDTLSHNNSAMIGAAAGVAVFFMVATIPLTVVWVGRADAEAGGQRKEKINRLREKPALPQHRHANAHTRTHAHTPPNPPSCSQINSSSPSLAVVLASLLFQASTQKERQKASGHTRINLYLSFKHKSSTIFAAPTLLSLAAVFEMTTVVAVIAQRSTAIVTVTQQIQTNSTAIWDNWTSESLTAPLFDDNEFDDNEDTTGNLSAGRSNSVNKTTREFLHFPSAGRDARAPISRPPLQSDSIQVPLHSVDSDSEEEEDDNEVDGSALRAWTSSVSPGTTLLPHPPSPKVSLNARTALALLSCAEANGAVPDHLSGVVNKIRASLGNGSPMIGTPSPVLASASTARSLTASPAVRQGQTSASEYTALSLSSSSSLSPWLSATATSARSKVGRKRKERSSDPRVLLAELDEKRQKNTESARRSRIRRLAFVESLKQTISEANRDREEAEQRAQELEQSLAKMRTMIDEANRRLAEVS
ncbi:hypothetical protein DFJ73DRAFT_963318 [Zopfochytrium polystomum]|nr:hypothetical protein DFJ73DRAFT_963318 [Zopfochytrium polystomum]